MKEYAYSKFEATKDQLKELLDLVQKKVSEKVIDEFIVNNPEIIAFALSPYQTGHHGVKVIPKQQIKLRNKVDPEDYGLIPDFLVGGENSDGYQWWVIEIKGINEQLFNKDATGRISFTDTSNKGIFQLLEYIDFCNKYQGVLRETFGLQDFREPNGILIIGHEAELHADLKKKAMKSAWNRMHQKRLEIRTFSWLATIFRNEDSVHDFRANKGEDW